MGRAQSIYTIEEYLRLERASEERHYYIDGHIYAMAGESLSHSRICINLAAEVRTQLKGKPCEALSPNMKVRSGPAIKRDSKAGLFSYADLVVICGEPRFHDEHQDALLNPTAIFEVLSTTTEAFDRGDKFLRYRTWNETLTDYEDQVSIQNRLCAIYHDTSGIFERKMEK
jgi:Uma2 family endonuclease